MTISIEELEQRLAALEREVRALRQWARKKPAEKSPPAQAIAPAPNALGAAWARVMEQLGICGEPISSQRLREHILADGFEPENNEFSRGIVEMREE